MLIWGDASVCGVFFFFFECYYYQKLQIQTLYVQHNLFLLHSIKVRIFSFMFVIFLHFHF